MYEFCGFPLERISRKSLEVRFDFGPRPGFSKQLLGSSREGTELDRTCLQQFLLISVVADADTAMLCSGQHSGNINNIRILVGIVQN